MTPLPEWGGEGALSVEADHRFTLQELWPYIQAMGVRHRFLPEIIAAMIYQESNFQNLRVHRDGTGHGLLGLDQNGLLQDFEPWALPHLGRGWLGRGADATVCPPEWQIEFAAWQLHRYVEAYADVRADPIKAAQAWHASGGGRNSARGTHYGTLIRAHIKTLGV